MLLAMSIIPFIDIGSKNLTQSMGVFEITFWRNLIHFILFIPLMLRQYGKLFVTPKSPKMQVMRGIFLTATNLFFVAAIIDNPIPVALAIVFIDPILIMFMSSIFLGEKFGKMRLIASIIGFIGVLIVMNPRPSSFNPSLLFALGAGFCFASYQIITKTTSKGDGAVLTSFYTGVVGMLFVLPIAALNLSWPSAELWPYILLMGSASALGHYIIILAFRHGEASLIGNFGYFELVAAGVLNYFIFQFIPEWREVWGMIVIVGSGLFISYREWVAGKSNH